MAVSVKKATGFVKVHLENSAALLRSGDSPRHSLLREDNSVNVPFMKGLGGVALSLPKEGVALSLPKEGVALSLPKGAIFDELVKMPLGFPKQARSLFAQTSSQLDSQLENGKLLYQSGQFLQAANIWKNTAEKLASFGDIPNQALVLSYLSLTYQQLGQPEASATMMAKAMDLITTEKQKLPFIFAQILNNQGQLQLSQGKPEIALLSWQQSEKLYREIGDRTGIIGTQLNQARSLQVLGFYLRARKILQQLELTLNSDSDSQLKFLGLLNLGNVLRVVGDFSSSQKLLEQSLAIAQKLQLTQDIPVVLLSLGNLAQEAQPETALKFYQQASVANSPVKLQAQIHQLEILIQLKRQGEAKNLVVALPTLANLPANQTTIYAQIELAENLIKLDPKATSEAAKILATAQQQAKTLGNPRAQSYALGRLGRLYEQTQQWEEAKRLTQQALNLVQAIRAPEIAYQWQWQLGRLSVKTAKLNEAIAAYTEAVKSLQLLRQDLVATDQDLQLSFRESIEPVYRELVDLLLQTANASPSQEQENLILARTTIEALSLAELTNFFREACLDSNSKPQSIEQVDQTAAVIYPIILSDRLEVIFSLPGQPLRHFATRLPQQQVEDLINQMRQSLRRTSFAQERLPIAQQLYTWLVQPMAADLAGASIKTLVFVLDGDLRNIPMAALYDGKQYLIEQYRIAIAPSLQLIASRPIAQTQLKALVAGVTQGNQDFSALPGVKQEVDAISKTISSTTLLDQKFTSEALQNQLKKHDFSMMHLATHGQFSSKASETFILTWDQSLNVRQFNVLLANRDLRAKPIELLVLSACQTAQGDKRAALGLAGVAVRSGARSTLATLWTVNDLSTKDFMVQFYQELLKSNTSKAEAVRLAQLSLLQQPEFSHPFYWAAFILVGNWL